jgi:hypothetical protein
LVEFDAQGMMPPSPPLAPGLTRLVAQTAVGALVQAPGVETIEPVLSRHTPSVPEVRMTGETPKNKMADSASCGRAFLLQLAVADGCSNVQLR